MLGANIGTTLIVQALSFDVSASAPVLFFLGILAFNVGGHTIARDLGRVAIGLGLHAAIAPYPDRYAGSCRNRASRADRSCGGDRRARPLRGVCRRAHLGGSFQCGGGAARHVARLFAFCKPCGRLGTGSWRQSWKRYQSAARRQPREPRQPPPARR